MVRLHQSQCIGMGRVSVCPVHTDTRALEGVCDCHVRPQSMFVPLKCADVISTCDCLCAGGIALCIRIFPVPINMKAYIIGEFSLSVNGGVLGGLSGSSPSYRLRVSQLLWVAKGGMLLWWVRLSMETCRLTPVQDKLPHKNQQLELRV